MLKIILILGATLGMLAIVAGSIGGHNLKSKLEKELVTKMVSSEAIPQANADLTLIKESIDKRLNTFEIAARYQMYSALAMVLVALVGTVSLRGKTTAILSGFAFFLGSSLFAGSLYGISFFDKTELAILTPFGGILMILGWAFLLVTCLLFQVPQADTE